MSAGIELKRCLEQARKAAVEAGTLLREHFLRPRTVAFKGRVDLVTEMDRRSEQVIVETLHAAFPDHAILAEEGARIETASGFLWVIDPLDGTTNYAHGHPHFAVSIGLEHGGEVLAGVVHDPMHDELFTAARGGGAFLNGSPIRVSSVELLIRGLVATGFPYDRMSSPVNNLDHFAAMLMHAQEIRRCGSAALDLCYVAMGRLDGYWELKLKPWDTAAGSLIVSEAGGMVSNMFGDGYHIREDSIVASNGRLHGQMLEVLSDRVS